MPFVASAQCIISAIRSVSETVVGSAVYDALIAACAVKAGAGVRPTWNSRDFFRVLYLNSKLGSAAVAISANSPR